MLPLLGPKTLLSSSEFPQPLDDLPDLTRLVADLLREHGLPGADGPGGVGAALDALRVPGVRRPFFAAGARPWLASARGFTLHEAEVDDRAPARKQAHPDHPPLLKRRVSFELGPGSYATVLMRFLLPPARKTPVAVYSNSR